MPDNHFILSMSYGAVDQLVFGTWKQEGNKIMMEQAKKEIPPPFMAYGRKGKDIEKGKLFSFRGTDRNTSIAFSFADTPATDNFKLLHLPNQNLFSHEERLNVISKPVKTFFMAELSGEDERIPNQEDSLYTIYQFTANDSINEIRVYYNPPVNQTPLIIHAVLKNNELYFISNETEKRFGSKEESPYDYKKSLDYALKSTQIPDTLSTADGNSFIRIKLIENFKKALSINPNTAFFEKDEEGTESIESAVTAPVLPIEEPSSGTKQKGSKKKK